MDQSERICIFLMCRISKANIGSLDDRMRWNCIRHHRSTNHPNHNWSDHIFERCCDATHIHRPGICLSKWKQFLCVRLDCLIWFLCGIENKSTVYNSIIDRLSCTIFTNRCKQDSMQSVCSFTLTINIFVYSKSPLFVLHTHCFGHACQMHWMHLCNRARHQASW